MIDALEDRRSQMTAGSKRPAENLIWVMMGCRNDKLKQHRECGEHRG